MSLNHKLLTLLRNPLIVIPPLILILAIAWQHYTYAGRDLNLPQSSNLLPGGVFADFNSDGIPSGWSVNAGGQLDYSTGAASGYAGGQALKLTVKNYENGNVSLMSPKVSVKTGLTYLFKGYYTSTAPFTLSIRKYYANSTSTLSQVQTYQATAGQWTTASDAFEPTSGVTAVQFEFRMYGNGALELNSYYLEPKQHVYVAGDPGGDNLIPNSQLSSGTNNSPAGWSTYHEGLSTAAFSYLQDASGSYVQVRITDYKNGEAKWQYPPVPVQPRQYYQFSMSYKSDTALPIIAEYVLQNGSRQYQTVAQLSPAESWTNALYTFETPPDASNMFVSLPLQHNGVASARSFQLINITKPPASQWPGPAISLTFDSGRSAQFDNAEPLLKQYGYKATFYINPVTIETSGFMSADELSELSNSGNEIGARGYSPDDMTAINESALDYQLHEGRDYLRAAGFQVTDFAAPYGRSDPEVQYYARQYFDTLRGTDTGINTWQNLNPYDLKVLNISDATSKQSLQSTLASARSTNGWLILVYQGVGDAGTPSQNSSTEQTNISTDSFKQQLELIKKSGIKVAPVNSVYSDIRQ